MNHVLTLTECKSYATEANLMKALNKTGLDNYACEGEVPCRFIVCQNGEGRWTAIFMVSEYFRTNKTGGYIGFAGRHGFMSI